MNTEKTVVWQHKQNQKQKLQKGSGGSWRPEKKNCFFLKLQLFIPLECGGGLLITPSDLVYIFIITLNNIRILFMV